ncbi:MAG: HK97-gp10 family putative phage morphogenesis protein [bacterium]
MKTVFGFRETQRYLKMMQSKVEQRTNRALQDAALVVERAAKENIVHGRSDWPALKPSTLARRKDNKPLYDTGDLMRSIHSDAGEMRAVVGSGRRDAPVHELGTKTAGRKKNVNIPARPYLEPACRENMNKVKEVFVQRLRGH